MRSGNSTGDNAGETEQNQNQIFRDFGPRETGKKGIKVLHAGPLGPQVPQVTGFDDLCQGGFGPEQYIRKKMVIRT